LIINIYCISTTENWDVHNFESEILSDFYDKYHTILVCNGSLSFGKDYNNLINIKEQINE